MGNNSTNTQLVNEPIDANTVANTKAVLDTLPDHSRGAKLSDFTKPNDEFPEGLSPAEQKLLHACTRGEECIIGNGTRPTSSTRGNKIRGSFLRYLILGGCEDVPIHQKGIILFGAFVVCRNRKLDLDSANILKDVCIENCTLNGSIILMDGLCQSFSLKGSLIEGLKADRLIAKGSLFLSDNFCSINEVRFVGSKIESSLICNGGNFRGLPVSLSCDGSGIQGSIFFTDGFIALGEVRLTAVIVGSEFDCSKGNFKGTNNALSFDRAKIGGTLFLTREFSAVGHVRLFGTQINGDISCRDGVYFGDILAPNTIIGGNIWLDGNFQIKGSVNLGNAGIGGNINCTYATFHNKERAILANKAIIKGNVILGDCNSAGGFSFQGAEIDGDFSAQGAIISAKKSIEFRNANIAGTFHWRDVTHAPGMLDLGGATIKTLNMDQASWQKPASIKLNNFTYQGFSDLEEGTNSDYWKRFLQQQPKADLTNKFRPKPFEHLANVLQGMGFEEEAKNIRIERQSRQTEFMAKHDPDRFAKDIQGNERIKLMHLLTVFWRKCVSGLLVDYGYRPGKAAIYLFSLMMIGTLIYWHAAHSGIMTPTHPLIYKEATNGGFIPEKCAENWVHFPKDIASKCADAMPSEYSEFHSFIYAADVALPIVNLRMENDWSPRVVDTDGNPNWHGWWVRTFEWFLISAGWMLSLLFASAVGGIIRR